MHEILDDISAGRGTLEHLGLLEELGSVVKDASLCGLGQTSPNPVLSTLRYFREEYIEHIQKKRCPAGVCKDLITYAISENCTGCQLCLRSCPAEAIRGEKKERHWIDSQKCTKCGVCKSVCKFDAVETR
jgi:ferredoxin